MESGYVDKGPIAPTPERGHVPTLGEDPALGLSHRAKIEILLAILLGLFLGALDQTIVGTALPQIVTDLGGNELLHVGRHDLPADVHDLRAVLRQAVRRLRPQAAPHDRHHAVPRRVRPVRPQPGDVAADPVPGHPGTRRRRAVPDLARGHRRPVHARRTRPIPGPLRRSLRNLVHHRARARRLPDRPGQLALGVLREHPDRHHQPLHDLAAAADHEVEGRDQELRLPGRRGLHDLDDHAAGRPDQQAGGRLDRTAGRRPDRRRAHRHGDLPRDRVVREGADRPARPLARTHVLLVDALDVLRQLRLLRCDHLPAALVPGRAR